MTSPPRDARSSETLGLGRSEFLDRVRRALDDDAGPAPVGAVGAPPGIDDALLRLGPAPENRVRVFAEQAVAAGMSVCRCTSASFAEVLRDLLLELEAARATTTVAEGPLARAVRDAALGAGCEAVDSRSRPGLDAHFDVDVGITDVSFAIAETGTLVLESGPQRSRGTHLVPPVHIAIVPAESIVCDMIDYWANRARVLPSCSVLVSGPSKTADIEGILITGVHGPRAVHVILVDDAAGAVQAAAPTPR